MNPNLTAEELKQCEEHICNWDLNNPACAETEGYETDFFYEPVLIPENVSDHELGIGRWNMTREEIDNSPLVHAYSPHPFSIWSGFRKIFNSQCLHFSEGWESWYLGELFPRKEWKDHICMVPGSSYRLPIRASVKNISMCENDFGPRFQHGRFWGQNDDPYWSEDNPWPQYLACGESQWEAGSCPLGIYTLWDGSHFFSDTCICETDEHCQMGAVCEGGYNNEDAEFLPRPHYCIWNDEGDESSNGFLPDGPAAYGLKTWSEGLEVIGNEIYLSTSMWIRARQGALWNDDQRVSTDGLVTHCGPNSLCSHLGFKKGDVLEISEDIPFLLDSLEPAIINIERANGDFDYFIVMIY